MRPKGSLLWQVVHPRLPVLSCCLLLLVINRMAGFAIPLSTSFLISHVIQKHESNRLPMVVGGVLLATLIQAITSYVLTQVLSKSSWRIVTDLRIAIHRHISRLPLAYFDAHRTGTLVSRIMSDVEGIRNVIGAGLIDFVGGLLTASIAFCGLLYINWKITLCVTFFLACFALVQRKVFQTIRPIARERGAITAEVTGRLTESLAGIRVVKSYRAEERESTVFAEGARRLLNNYLVAIHKTSLTSMASSSVVGLVAATIMYLGATQILSGSLTLANYVVLTMLLALMVAPVTQVVSVGTQISEALAGFERSQEILNEATEDEEVRRTLQLEPGSIRGQMKFIDVSFSYIEGKRVLHTVSFTAEPGTVTALVGSSGSGKSTLIGMACAFYRPDEGQILLDGIDLSQVELESYRSNLGVVLQESFLFEGSIRDNIVFSRPGATDEELNQAIRIARVDEFLVRLPEGLNTIVGERGVKLSGGQRQRVSIARAVLANPRILILDEATSSLDSESEALIQEGLAQLVQGRTTFVIAHRLSTIRNADLILVVEEGRIVEQGSHQDLLARQGRYYQLYTRQHAVQHNLFLAPGESPGEDADSASQTAESESAL